MQAQSERPNRSHDPRGPSSRDDLRSQYDFDPDAPRTRRESAGHGEGVPKWIVVTLEASGLLLGAFLIAYGHPLYVCHHLKDAGQFYYGTTMKSCVVEQASRNLTRAHEFVATLTAGR